MDTSSAKLSPVLEALRALSHPAADDPQNQDGAMPGFCGSGTLALDAVAVDIQGLGPLAQPLTAAQAQALHAISTPARYGKRRATLLDRQVRDTGEIDAGALTLRWADGALPALLSEVARHLGVQRLQAHAHKLLVYGAGQFFKPHQDTEKHPGMVATLVLVWPSAHIGGDLLVHHGKANARFASQHLQARGLRWFAFYADCRHEVLPVVEGWRVVLTLDLVVPQVTAAGSSATPDHGLLAALRSLFEPATGPRTAPWVFLLEHEYTEHGLRWALLKGEDRTRAQALRTAAQALGLQARLALAEIHESWTAIEQPSRRGRAPEPEADELIDEDMRLNFWVDTDDHPVHHKALAVSRGDAEGFSDTGETFLVDEEYEGYMGNYGETLDFWYRRAAVVLQSAHGAEVSRFATDFDAALDDALALARRPGSGDVLGRRLAAAGSELQSQRHLRGQALFAAYAALACALPNALQARSLCEGFRWAGMRAEDAEPLARMAAHFGERWVQDLLEQNWASLPSSPWLQAWGPDGKPHRLWPWPLQTFMDACGAAGVSSPLRSVMLDRCLALLANADAALTRATPTQRNASWSARLEMACDLASALAPWPVQATAQQRQLLEHVLAHPTAYPLRRLALLCGVLPAGSAASPQVHALRAAVDQSLRAALARPVPSADDRSLDALEIEWTCRCADCMAVVRWASLPAAQPLVLAMVEARRTHVQAKLVEAAAPIGTQTLKQGSPHKLVLSKPADLPALREHQRASWQEALAMMEGPARPGRRPTSRR